MGGLKYHKPTDEELKSGSYIQYEPDYYNDLNLMHEAEKVLTDAQYCKFDEMLYDMCAENYKMIPYKLAITGMAVLLPERKYIRALSSTASQRCEAFLKTLGLWKEPSSTNGKEWYGTHNRIHEMVG